MSKFFVKDTFEIPCRQLFALSGRVVEGEIHTGMFVPVMYNTAVQITARIHSVEYAENSSDGKDMCLCLETGHKMLPVWSGLDIKNTTLEVKNSQSARHCPPPPDRPDIMAVRYHDTAFTVKVKSLKPAK